ncbi:amino acid ABC transporter permease [Clostridiaceae bacterium NSJ-31]|uniref:Amino acid ABC transporter permease n=1 Tax=Ligaoa zhengdingensis TaxID=2763658 RepID=A0A926HYZ9_9FIRM|nr:amino acid ABC transporter permease [Ligaoa zhengdingensis]MBC8545387.1 amino acid ABC transporter permease [Ligaoa zhengdingensis]
MDFQNIWNTTLNILTGAGTTISLFLVTILLSLPLGFCFTLIARSKIGPVRWVMNGIIYIVRGTPLLLQLLFVYFGLPYLPLIGDFLRMERFTASCVTFVVNYACYFAEIFRGGLLAVNKGQYEAAKVLGMSKVQTMMRVICPQMVRVALPSIGNEAVTLVKDTALVFTIGVTEILHLTKTAVSRDKNTFFFVIAAVIYLVMNTVLTYAFKKVEAKINYEKEG